MDYLLQAALIIVEILRPPAQSLLGTLCLLCSPSEGVACLLVLLSEADLTLSILLIIVVNLAALGALFRPLSHSYGGTPKALT